MGMAEMVTVSIDGRDVQVAKGTGLVETALAAGIEIPVFCYEPRLGAPVGACRMCLVEVEGMPKLQAGCTLTATDGMVVRTAQTSKLAADGQSSTLEFILVNHPLDCPVCDKGGECPLQDLTFRWGPPVTRNTFPKRTFEKPIPISPTIALDRERCILCYRCTRFSSDVSEDDQLVARERGSQSIIATFEDQPYRAPFSGNVIELCPVGALTSTQYRFEARPWEIQDVPTVCGLCPVGCNVEATTREGKVKRIGSRNHPEIDEGWLCDKGRFGFTHLRAGDRVADPSRKVGVRRYETLSWDAALDEAEELLRAGGANIVTALSGSETTEQAYALGKLLRKGLGAHCAVMPEDVSPALDAFRLPLSAIRDAELIVILGDDPVVERAPVVDLWIKAARRAGAEVVESEIGEPGGGVARVRDELGERIRTAERTVLIWSGPDGNGGATIAGLAAELGLAEKPSSGAFHLPETVNARGVADGWAAAADGEDADPEPIELLIVSGDEAAANPDVRALAERAERVLAISMFRTPVAGWADLVLPGTSYLERDGTYVNLEGRLQRLRRAVIPPCPDELAWIAKLAERFDVELSPHAPQIFAELSERCYGGIDYPAIGELAELPERAAAPRSPRAAQGAEERAREGPAARQLPPALLRPGDRADPGAPVPAPRPGDRALARRRTQAGRRARLARAGAVERHLGRASRAREQEASRRSRPRRHRARTGARDARRGVHVNEPWWIDLIKAVVIINVLLGMFAYMTWVERKLLGRMQLRYGPNRAGPFGLLQPIADLVKLIRKESFYPATAVDFLYITAPIVSAFTALAAFAVIPWGEGWHVAGYDISGEIADVPISLILIFALGALGVYGFIVGGWASDSKYALLGSMRTCAQMVSYEVALALSVLGVVLMSGTLSLTGIVDKQQDTIWYAVPQFVGLLVFLAAGTAETNRPPFDLPEADTELVAGYHTEYSGMRFGLFSMAEYVNMIVLSGLCVTLFLGGWLGPWAPLGPVWFLLKVLILIFLFIWLRATLPRLRYDQLMAFGWKVLLPVATLNALVTAALVVAFS